MLSEEFKKRSLFASLPFVVSTGLNVALIPYVIKSIGLSNYGLWNIILGIYVISNLPRLGFAEVFISESYSKGDLLKRNNDTLYARLYFSYFVITATTIFFVAYLFADWSPAYLSMGFLLTLLEILYRLFKLGIKKKLNILSLMVTPLMVH